MVVVLVNTLNALWFSDTVPESWLLFKILPIPKNNSDSFRPIALSSCVRKMVESIFNSRLSHWLEINDMLPPDTYAFRTDSNSLDCVSRLTSSIYQAYNSKQFLNAAFLDISAAFDRVHIPTLISSLIQLSIPQRFIQYIVSLFSVRTLIFSSGQTAIFRKTYRGLPQGSSLSPLLFNLYMLPIVSLHTECSVLLFADDVAVYSIHKDALITSIRLSAAISRISTILNERFLTLSDNKCKSVMFTYRPFNIAHSLVSIGDLKLSQCDSYKYLGFILDSRLTWRPHIKYIQKRGFLATNILKALSSVHWGADPLTLSLFYKSFVRSVIDYGSFIFGNASSSNLICLDRVQNQSLRLIVGARKSTPIQALQAETAIPPLHIRRLYLAHRYVYAKSSRSDSLILPQFFSLVRTWRLAPRKLPLISRIASLSTETCSALLKTNKYRYYNLPYFEIFHSHPYDKLITDKKSPTLAADNIYSKMFSQLIACKYPSHIRIFTDASKKGLLCGAAFFIEHLHTHKTFSLPPITSIFSAELFAILFSLRFIINSSLALPSPILVVSDSLSAIVAITSPLFKNKYCPIIMHIRNLLQYLMNFKGSPVSFLWVPSHSGIPGNEFVDHLSGSVSESTHPKTVLSLHDAYFETKSQLLQQWNFSYKQLSNPLSFYFRLQPDVPPFPWYKYVGSNHRKFFVKICRLRFGHTGLPAHIHRFIPSVPPYCPLHLQNETPADPNHILFSCPKLLPQQLAFESQLIALLIPRPWSLLSLLALPATYEVIYQFLLSLPSSIQI